MPASFLARWWLFVAQTIISIGHILLVLAGAIVAGFSYAMVMNLTDKEDPFVVVFYFSFSSAILSLPIMIFQYEPIAAAQWIALLLTGLCAAGGQITLTYSYKYAKASDVSVYSFL